MLRNLGRLFMLSGVWLLFIILAIIIIGYALARVVFGG
jgi:hypothetical protein